MRWLTWIALGFLVYFALKSKRRPMGGKGNPREQRAHTPFGEAQSDPLGFRDASASSVVAGESMVACSYCQLFIPVSEAFPLKHGTFSGNVEAFFCCEEHRQRGLSASQTDSSAASTPLPPQK
jgi:hypothetical protein